MKDVRKQPVDLSSLLQLSRWNTPNIYNGWDQLTERDRTRDGISIEESTDFMPQMGPMVGYAVTMVIEPSNPKHQTNGAEKGREFREYIAQQPGPKIVVVQDLDKPAVIGSAWGEVSASISRALGCIGTITDGAIRDVDEMTAVGFKAIARRLCVGHAHVCPVRFNCSVEVFGQKVSPGDLIHADKHGFLVIEPEVQDALLAAATFMDRNECDHVIAAARNATGLPHDEIVDRFENAVQAFSRAAHNHFGRGGEWG
jgi:regulator of RNase E activity RraA